MHAALLSKLLTLCASESILPSWLLRFEHKIPHTTPAPGTFEGWVGRGVGKLRKWDLARGTRSLEAGSWGICPWVFPVSLSLLP